MKLLIQKLLLPLFVMSFMGINSASALTINFTPQDRIPGNQCTKTSCQLPIASEDPCGEGGVTVLDPSGSPSCEPIARIVPAVTKKLREAANLLEYKLYKATGSNATVNNFISRTGTEEAQCDGIFCSCSGPSDSDDCNTIKACIDEISCIGDSCGCIGGNVE